MLSTPTNDLKLIANLVLMFLVVSLDGAAAFGTAA